MKYLIIGFVFLVSLNSIADEYKHQVSIGRNGLGWSGSSEYMDTNRNSFFGSVTRLLTDLGLNYAYRLDRFQLGGFYQSSNDEYKFRRRGGGYSPTSIESETFGIFALYNFSDHLASAWYTGLSLGSHKYTEENSHDFESKEGKSPFELDDSGVFYEISVGKRFDLEFWAIRHITFSPMISLFEKTHGKDFDDQDVERGVGVSVQPIRFDVLF